MVGGAVRGIGELEVVPVRTRRTARLHVELNERARRDVEGPDVLQLAVAILVRNVEDFGDLFTDVIAGVSVKVAAAECLACGHYEHCFRAGREIPGGPCHDVSEAVFLVHTPPVLCLEVKIRFGIARRDSSAVGERARKAELFLCRGHVHVMPDGAAAGRPAQIRADGHVLRTIFGRRIVRLEPVVEGLSAKSPGSGSPGLPALPQSICIVGPVASLYVL